VLQRVATHQARRHGRDPLDAGRRAGDRRHRGDVGIRDERERGLARLTHEQRSVVVLVYYLDLPLADAAQAMGVPLGTAKSRLNRATSALRAAIEADDREPARVREQIA
jgi:DNA-directed RNA polymerase specialized sigma24 family protein